MDESASVALIRALSDIWGAIRRHHPEVPPVMLIPAPAARGRRNVLGHFAALRWRAKDRVEHRGLHEVVVVAEHLNRDAAAIAETLLHEAAHALNHERGIFDCSASQYHNAKFKAAAEELGLEVARVAHYGWAFTTLPEATAARYDGEIAQLASVLIHRYAPDRTKPPPDGDATTNDGTKGKEGKPRSRSRKATCACGHIIRLSKKTYEDTVIRCESCGEPFRIG